MKPVGSLTCCQDLVSASAWRWLLEHWLLLSCHAAGVDVPTEILERSTERNGSRIEDKCPHILCPVIPWFACSAPSPRYSKKRKGLFKASKGLVSTTSSGTEPWRIPACYRQSSWHFPLFAAPGSTSKHGLGVGVVKLKDPLGEPLDGFQWLRAWSLRPEWFGFKSLLFHFLAEMSCKKVWGSVSPTLKWCHKSTYLKSYC